MQRDELYICVRVLRFTLHIIPSSPSYYYYYLIFISVCGDRNLEITIVVENVNVGE